MKKSLSAAVMCSALVLSLGLATAHAQEAVSRSDAENTELYFVELSGRPVADGNSLNNVRAEKARFLSAADSAGLEFTVRRGYDTLFNGYAVQASAADRASLARMPGVKALWPIEVIEAPEFDPIVGAFPNLDTAIAMTRANIVQDTLGYRGTGIKVAVMDTGIDYDHADLGGDGVDRANSTVFPTARVIAGWDFVGDDFNFDQTPVPDPYPDDCNGHGTHVAGIVGASGDITGVAPDVQFGAYRVFGCAGSTTADIMLAAMERAYADGMHILNMSIGSRAQWPQYPTAAASSRLVKRGMVVVASIGNNGPGGSQPDGPYAAGAPGVGEHVIGVASYDNSHIGLPYFTVAGQAVGYQTMTFSPTPPTSGSEEIVFVGQGCNADTYLTDPAGKVALVVRGACSFAEKANKAIAAGATAVVVHNNVPGVVAGTLGAPLDGVTPVVGISQADGLFIRAQAAPVSLTWTDQADLFPNVTGNLISGFSSFGMAADLSLKPDIGAPGGLINSTIPLDQGGYGVISGTSMSSPHVAGAVALLLQTIPEKHRHMHPAQLFRDRLQNNANPTVWSGNPALGFLEQAHRQGAGLLDIEAAILATVDVLPGKLSLGESEAGPQTRRLTIRNRGSSVVTYDLSNMPALATGPKNPANFATIGTFAAFAGATFSSASVAVPAGGVATVDVTITAPASPNQGQYGGYIVLTPQGGGNVMSVPYAGFIGDYQTVRVLTPTANGFPWLAQIVGTSFFNRPTGAVYTMVGDDVPQFLVHLDHQSERLNLIVHRITYNRNGHAEHTPYHNISDDSYVGRNTTAGGFFALPWDGTTFKGGGPSPLTVFTVPDGDYQVTIRVTKALGSKNNAAHTETWTSPVFTIDRP